jgi:hypothetical protein
MNLPATFAPSLKQIFITFALTLVLILALCTNARADDGAMQPDDNLVIIKMKMAEYLNSSIEQGIATVNKMKRLVDAAPVSPTVTKLKMDKINSRYVEKDDEVYDRVHNLTWARCSLGQHWVKSQGCVGSVRQVSFDQAARFSSTQWRLPTQAELASLIDPTKKTMPLAMSIDTVAFPDMDVNKLYYWTNTEENNSFAWAVLFVDSGIPSILHRSHRYALRLVRTGT